MKTPKMPAVLAALGLGLFALAWGVAGLQRIFDAELEEARLSLEAEKRALSLLGERELRSSISEEMRRARGSIREAVSDPLLADTGLYLRRGDRVVLPRAASPMEGEGAPARGLYSLLIDPAAVVPEEVPDEVWAVRLDLLRSVQRSIVGGGPVEARFRSLLTHRARYRIASERDLPYQLALLDFFVAEGSPDRGLVRHLLRDGFTSSEGIHLPGLQRQLLERLDRFSRTDIEFVTERIIVLSESAGVPYDDFLARLFDLRLCLSPLCERLEYSPEEIRAPSLPEELVIGEEPVIASGSWLFWSRADGIEGARLDIAAQVKKVEERLEERGLIVAGDRIVAKADGPYTPVVELKTRLESPRFEDAFKESRRRHRLKSALGGMLAISTLGIVALVGLLVVRERRHLQLRSDLVSAVSHELRTPLASVRLLAETLERRLGGLPEARDYPARIVREADRLGLLVENILSFNRLESGGSIFRPSRVDLAEIAESLREDVAPYLRGELELDLSGIEMAHLAADPELFRLLLLNLFSNSARYCERDPVRIELSSRQEDRQVVLRVRDNGIGIAEKDHELIFTEFYRRDTGGERAAGYGLGLAICRRIMALHGGSILVAASGTDGTCFELRFPMGQ